MAQTTQPAPTVVEAPKESTVATVATVNAPHLKVVDTAVEPTRGPSFIIHSNVNITRYLKALVYAAYGGGKAQPLGCKIITPNGWTTMGKIKVGDEVITPSGQTASVTGCFPQ